MEVSLIFFHEVKPGTLDKTKDLFRFPVLFDFDFPPGYSRNESGLLSCVPFSPGSHVCWAGSILGEESEHGPSTWEYVQFSRSLQELLRASEDKNKAKQKTTFTKPFSWNAFVTNPYWISMKTISLLNCTVDQHLHRKQSAHLSTSFKFLLSLLIPY